MGRVYSREDCLRKENQSWELAGCARQDGDLKEAARHTEEARQWRQRAMDGGYEA